MSPPDAPRSAREAQRERLALLCALDRAALRLALRPRPAAPSGLLGGGLNQALRMTAHLPGAPGRWSRRIALALGIFKTLG